MAKNTQPPKDEKTAALEQKVKAMMDPSVPDPKPAAKSKLDAADLAALPVPKEPLKIKILRDGEEPTTEADIPLTAPVLKGAPKVTEPVPEPLKPKEPAKPETPAAEEPAKDTPVEGEPPEDPITAHAVDDIVRNESDVVLAAEDAKRNVATDGDKPKKKKPGRGKRILKLFIFLLFIGALVAGITPTSRYYALNTAGVRAKTSIHILDQSTQQPLKNAKLRAEGVEALTDENGDATLDGLKLGPTQLRLEKVGFATITKNVTIGWGSNPMGEEKMTPTGAQYAFMVVDYLSGKPIVKAEATSGQANAFSDKKGKLLLTLDKPDDKFEIIITAAGRRPEKFAMTTSQKPEDEKLVKMVPSRKHAYSVEQGGRFDLYAAYADGKDAKLILKGTGSETEDITLAQHPSDEVVAMVSTRSGKQGKDGQLLHDLTVVNTRTKQAKTVQTADQIQLVGWMSERLIYVRVVPDTKNDDPQRNRLVAYHYKDETNNQLAAANYFNDIITAGGRIYFAPSAAHQEPGTAKLYSFSPDGTDKKTILDQSVWNLFRSTYDHILISTSGNKWFDYALGDPMAQSTDQPTEPQSYAFIDSPNGKKSFWIEKRDGKNVLLVHDVASGEAKTLVTKNEPEQPAGWLSNDVIVYRVSEGGEIADWAVSLSGGEAKKIATVADTDSLESWYDY